MSSPRLCNVISQGVVPPLSLLKLPSHCTNHTKASRPRLLYNILLVNYLANVGRLGMGRRLGYWKIK